MKFCAIIARQARFAGSHRLRCPASFEYAMTLDDALEIEAETRTGAIKIHKAEDFEGMRRAGKLAAECLDMLIPHVVPGVVTDHLDTLAREFILDHGALPACLFYKGYSRTVCISPNHVVCHGIPGERDLREGDIANIDVTAILNGWHGDHSRMYGVGAVSPRARRLAMDHGSATPTMNMNAGWIMSHAPPPIHVACEVL